MRRARRWWLPVALALAALASAGTAAAVELAVPQERPPFDAARLGTPVVSVRRAPGVVAAPIAERRLVSDLRAWVAGQPADTCLTVRGVDGEIAFDHRSDAPLVPASTTKLLTGTAALLQLGPDFVYRTTAVAAGPPAAGVLGGDLTIVGGGDPLLASPDYAARFRRQPQTFTDLDALAAGVQAAGVRQIAGSVVGDESRYDAARYVDSWPQRYIDQDQIGPLSALSVNDGFALYPLAPGAPGELVAAPDPPTEAASVLTRLLEARGVDVVGEPRSGPSPAGAVEVASVESPPLDQVVAQMLRESDNSTAELLLKEVGRAAGAPSTPGGAVQAAEVLAGAGIELRGGVIADGSGLSPENRTTCATLVDLLTTGPAAEDLREGLAVAGETGTLAERFQGTDLAGVLRAKTGTLNSVTALGGVVDDDDPPLTFALIVNLDRGVVSLDLIGQQEQLAEVLLAWPRVPDVEVLGPRPAVSPPGMGGDGAGGAE